ncbi:MAG: AAA family ATPase [Chloroflexi bacterium]|nr:AAA family ATPase [Chloroflexota bacterium]
MNKPKGLGVPKVCERGAKIGVYGEPGTGKTELVMSATKYAHLLLMDCEGRSQYYDPNDGHGFEVAYSKSINDAIELLQYAESLHAQGKKVVFAIDGWSAIWQEQQEVAERIGATSRGTAKYSSWAGAKKPLKKFYALMYATPVDCIITMQSKPAYDDDVNKPDKLGYNTPITERGLHYAVDLGVEMHTDDLKPGTALTGENFWTVVTKTSGPKKDNPLPIGTAFRDPSFAKLLGLRLGGTGKLDINGDVDAQVLQALTATLSDLKALIADKGLDEEETFAHLRSKFGAYDRKNIPDYALEVLSMQSVDHIPGPGADHTPDPNAAPGSDSNGNGAGPETTDDNGADPGKADGNGPSTIDEAKKAIRDMAVKHGAMKGSKDKKGAAAMVLAGTETGLDIDNALVEYNDWVRLIEEKYPLGDNGKDPVAEGAGQGSLI